MAKRRRARESGIAREQASQQRLEQLEQVGPIAGVSGPGRWLVLEYTPTALFSLKVSTATSAVGRSLIVPTPYCIKMAFVDAAFRAGIADEEAANLLRSLVGVAIRISPPSAACVTHTFVKVRQEPKVPDPARPYIDTIAYREVVHHEGRWLWAFDLAAGDDALAGRLVDLAPFISYIGKRGSFIQFVGMKRCSEVGAGFTQRADGTWSMPPKAHIAPLDDFGPDAALGPLSSFSDERAVRGKHRVLADTVIPLGITNTGPGFTEYRSE